MRQLRSELSVPVIVNGGVDSVPAFESRLAEFDGVMVGRAAYQSPMTLGKMHETLYGGSAPDEGTVVESFLPYIEARLDEGVRLHSMTRHMLGLFQGRPGARHWRRQLSQLANRPGAGADLIRKTLADVAGMTRGKNGQERQAQA